MQVPSFNQYILNHLFDVKRDISSKNLKDIPLKEFGFVFNTMMDTTENVQVEKSSDILQLRSMSLIIEEYSKMSDINIVDTLFKASEQTKVYMRILHKKSENVNREKRKKIDFLYDYSALLFIIKMLSQMFIAIQYILIFFHVRERIIRTIQKNKHPNLLNPDLYMKKWPQPIGQVTTQPHLLDPVLYLKQWPQYDVGSTYISKVQSAEQDHNEQSIEKLNKIKDISKQLYTKLTELERTTIETKYKTILTNFKSDINKIIKTDIKTNTLISDTYRILNEFTRYGYALGTFVHLLKDDIVCTNNTGRSVCENDILNKKTLIEHIIQLINNISTLNHQYFIEFDRLQKEVTDLRMFKEAYYALSSIFMNKVFTMINT